MSNLNVTVLMGRLVRAPIIRNNGSKMGFFYIASNRRYRDKSDVAQEETAFVVCKCFGGWTDALARHPKGDMVMVEGRLRTETWNDEGTSRSQLILVCDSVQFVVPEPRPQNPSKPDDGDEREHTTPALGEEAAADRRFERRTHRRHSQFMRAEPGYPITWSAKSDMHGRICALTCSAGQSGRQSKNEVRRNPPASNGPSQPRFPSLCPKIESSSARNAGGVLYQQH